MERESLLAMLLMLFGGSLLQLCAAWPPRDGKYRTPRQRERHYWLRLWYPVVPTLAVALWLIGWGIREPDPVPDPVDPGIVVALSIPFMAMFLRAGLRALWSLLRRPTDFAVSTVGLIQPRVVFAPLLAKQLDEEVIRAAMLHECAHARHRDPLRIWLAQIVTDLQWPWPQATKRLEAWLETLELARDDEARAEGAEGTDLAKAILATLRYLGDSASTPVAPEAWLDRRPSTQVPLTGDAHRLRARIARLLAPLPPRVGADSAIATRWNRFAWTWVPLGASMIALGAEFGEHVIRPLLGLTS